MWMLVQWWSPGPGHRTLTPAPAGSCQDTHRTLVHQYTHAHYTVHGRLTLSRTPIADSLPLPQYHLAAHRSPRGYDYRAGAGKYRALGGIVVRLLRYGAATNNNSVIIITILIS